MPRPSEKEVKDAIEVILKDTKAYTTSLNWATQYCIVARGLTGDELRVQCLYILNNITHWHGEGSKDVRRILKEFTK